MKLYLSLLFSLGICATASYAQAQGLPHASAVECYEQQTASTNKSPFDLWRSISTCVAEEKYEQAVYLFGLAGSLGIFDSFRVKDTSAHQAAKVLPMTAMGSFPKDKSQAFQRKVQERFSDTTNRTALCVKYKGMPTPDYFPGYMIQHGMAAFSQTSKSDALVQPFNANEAWPKAVDTYMQCPKG